METDKLHGGNVGWHYTSAAGALGIIGGHHVYASWATALNDRLEVRFGAERLARAADSGRTSGWPEELVSYARDPAGMVKEAQRQAFVFCVAESDESLLHWQSYGRSGVAIGFTMYDHHVAGSGPIMAIYNPVYATEAKVGSREGESSGWVSMRYEAGDQDALTLEALSAVTLRLRAGATESSLTYCKETLLKAVLSMKHPGFAAEQEHRYIAFRPQGSDVVHHRVANDRIIPYVKLTGNRMTGPQNATGDVDEVGHLEHLPIYRVIVGPEADDVARDGLLDLLEEQGYLEALSYGVRRYQTPVRG